MLNKSHLQKFKIVLLLLILTISIASVSIITYFQNQSIKKQTTTLTFQSLQKANTSRFEEKLVELSNTLFLINKFEKNYTKYEIWSKIADQFELLRLTATGAAYFLSQFWKGENYWLQKSDYGNIFARKITWRDKWKDWNGEDNWKINVVPINDPAHYDIIKNVTVNDVKRFLFKNFQDWLALINPESKTNISQLRGFLQNKQIGSEIQKAFEFLAKIFKNADLINFFKNTKIINAIKNVDVDLILEIWKLWSNVLNPFYQKITKLKNNKSEKIIFLKEHFLETLTEEQKEIFLNLIKDSNIGVEKLIEKLHYFNGKNFVDSIKSEILLINDLTTVDWQNLLIKTLNKNNFKIFLNIFSVIIMEYYFDVIEEKPSFLPKQNLNGVLSDLLDFFQNGMFSNAKKFDLIVDGFVDGFENIIKQNPKFDIVLGTFKKLIDSDGKAWIFKIFESYTNSKILQFAKWIPKVDEFLAIAAKIFGDFKIQKLSYIFDNPETIKELKTKFNELKDQFQIISQNAGKTDLSFEKSLVDLMIKLKNLLKFLLSDKILNKKPGEEISINLWIWTTIGVIYGQTKNPIWNDVGEIIKIFAKYLKEEEVIDIIIRTIDLFDIFGRIVYDFTKWKSDQTGKVISDNEIRTKIYDLLGLTKETIDDSTFIGQFFKIILGIKEKYNDQIAQISYTGESIFESKVNDFWNMINLENWIYTIEKQQIFSNNISSTIYTIVCENKIPIKGKKYKYKAKISIGEGYLLEINWLKEEKINE